MRSIKLKFSLDAVVSPSCFKLILWINKLNQNQTKKTKTTDRKAIFLKISFFQANFCWAGSFGKNALSLARTCCWEIVNSGWLRGFRKDVTMQPHPVSLSAEKNWSNAPSPEQVFSMKPLTKRMDFTSNPRLLPALPQGFIKVHNHTAVYSWDSENNKVSSINF